MVRNSLNQWIFFLSEKEVKRSKNMKFNIQQEDNIEWLISAILNFKYRNLELKKHHIFPS